MTQTLKISMVLKNNQIKLVKAGELRHVVSYLNEIIVKLQWTSETTVIQHKYTHIKNIPVFSFYFCLIHCGTSFFSKIMSFIM